MKLSNVIYLIFATFFVLIATIIGYFLMPFFGWCCDGDGICVIFFILAFLACIILLILRKRINQSLVKVILPLVLPIFISSFITCCRFLGGGIDALNDFIVCYKTNQSDIYSKFGIWKVEGRYEYWGWGYDDSNKIFINYEHKYYWGDEDEYPSFHYDVYDEELNFINGYTDDIYEKRTQSDDRLRELYNIMECFF